MSEIFTEPIHLHSLEELEQELTLALGARVLITINLGDLRLSINKLPVTKEIRNYIYEKCHPHNVLIVGIGKQNKQGKCRVTYYDMPHLPGLILKHLYGMTKE